MTAASSLAVPAALAGAQTRQAPLISVGYWKGSGALEDLEGVEAPWRRPDERCALDAPFRSEIVDARALGLGDRRFVERDAMVSPHCICPRSESRQLERFDDLTVSADYRPFHDVEIPIFTAQGGQFGGHSCVAGAAVPIDAATGLALVVDEREGDTREAVRLRLTVSDERGAPKLRRGTYFIAFRDEAGALPDWSKYAVRAADKKGQAPKRVLYRQTRGGLELADFEYIVMNIDYSKKPEPPADVEAEGEGDETT